MNYYAPCYNDLGGIGEPMNPLFVDAAVALGPTRVMNVPDAGYAQVPHYGLDGRHFDRHYFENQNMQLYGWRDALDVFTAAAFLFPE